MHIPNILTTLLAFLLLASSAQATYVLAVFQDGECQLPVEGQAQTKVLSGTCDNNVKTGYSSFMVLHKWASPVGTLVLFDAGGCVYSSATKSHGYHNPDKNVCFKIGFTANAAYLAG